MTLSADERIDRMRRYAEGPARLEAALAQVPEKARQWRPGPGKWSAHIYAGHLENHSRQIERTLEAWEAAGRP